MPHRAVRAILLVVIISVVAVGWATTAFAQTPSTGSRPRPVNQPHREHKSFGDQVGPAPMAQAAAGVQLRLPYSDWLWPDPGYYSNISETLTIENGTTPGAPFFWSHQFAFQQGMCTDTTYPCQGYLGLQDGAPAKLAIFSIWDATAAKGEDCAKFSGEGAGYSCKLAPYHWQFGHDYQLRVRTDGTSSRGVWYKATVTDTATGTVRTIGRIRVPRGWGGIQGWTSWTEYLGNDPVSCAAFPKAIARWTYPVADNGAVSITGQSSEIGVGDCASKIVDVPGGRLQVSPK